jgi:hypothetical protein
MADTTGRIPLWLIGTPNLWLHVLPRKIPEHIRAVQQCHY